LKLRKHELVTGGAVRTAIAIRHISCSLLHVMPRNPNAGSSTLRNRNRVTNKTRLKIIQGNIDADPLILDEDEEKARVVSTAGVDAEDANVRIFFPSFFLIFFCLSFETALVAHSDWLASSEADTWNYD
jgi:hypothetical protein